MHALEAVPVEVVRHNNRHLRRTGDGGGRGRYARRPDKDTPGIGIRQLEFELERRLSKDRVPNQHKERYQQYHLRVNVGSVHNFREFNEFCMWTNQLKIAKAGKGEKEPKGASEKGHFRPGMKTGTRRLPEKTL
jgi:hypothetical protein